MQENINKLLAQRMVPLTGQIDDDVASSVLAMMLFLFDRDRNSPIYLIIDSEGGLASSGLAIIDLIRRHARLVHTVVPRCAAGLATVILACGTKGHRRVGKHAAVQISPLKLQHETPQISAYMARVRDELTEILASCTGQRRNSIRGDLFRGRTLNAESALAYGLVDAIIGD